MAIRSLLVLISDDKETGTRLKAASQIAQRFGAFVTGLYLASPPIMQNGAVGRGMSMAYMEEHKKTQEKSRSEAEAHFRATLSEAGVSHSWTEEEGDHISVLEKHARATDLALLSQTRDATVEDYFRHHFAEEAVVMLGVPVLVLPAGYEVGDLFCRKILIAWKSTREGVRAVRDSMEFLKAAQEVTLFSAGQPEDAGRLPIEQVQAYLARHGVEVRLEIEEKEPRNVGELILKKAEQVGADTILMGLAARPRYREIVLGGASHHLFDKSNLPLLVSH